MKKKLLMTVVAVLAASLMIGCDVLKSAKPIKIAGIFALTGRAAHIGTSQRDAVLLAIDDVNAQGVLTAANWKW
jgi:ABC-type branched-subunit amino acid transport system substrate-binding protein